VQLRLSFPGRCLNELASSYRALGQFQDGALAFAVLQAGSAGTVMVRNPWGTTPAAIVDSQTQQTVSTSGTPLSFSAQVGHANPAAVNMTGTAPTAPKRLASRPLAFERRRCRRHPLPRTDRRQIQRKAPVRDERIRL